MIGTLANIGLFALKLSAGLVGHSAALVADAFHSAADVLITVGAFLGLWVGERPPDVGHPYGHRRFETEVTRVLALILAGTAVWIGYSALRELILGTSTPPSWITLAAAVVSLIAKEILFRYTAAVGRAIKSAAVQASAWDHRSDVFASSAALVGIAGARTGWPALDPVAGLLVAALVLAYGGRIYWQSVAEQVDASPVRDLTDRLEAIVQHVPGVREVQSIRGRRHGPEMLVDVKLSVDPEISVRAGHDIADHVRDAIRTEYEDVREVLVHVNPDR